MKVKNIFLALLIGAIGMLAMSGCTGFMSKGKLCRQLSNGDVEIFDLFVSDGSKYGLEIFEEIIPKEINYNAVAGVYIFENTAKWNQKTKVFWEGGFPVEWEKVQFTNEFLNVFWDEEMPAWLKNEERYLPGKIACPQIFRERYGDCYAPERAMTFHYNFEDAPNQDIYWYYPFFNDEDAIIYLSRIPKPVRYGYEFKGWYDNRNCDNGERIDKIVGEAELQYYAKWEATGEPEQRWGYAKVSEMS